MVTNFGVSSFRNFMVSTFWEIRNNDSFQVAVNIVFFNLYAFTEPKKLAFQHRLLLNTGGL